MHPTPSQEYRLREILGSLQIRVEAMVWCDLDASWSGQQWRNDFWRFYVNNGDGAAIEAGGQPLPLHRGQAYLIPAFVPIRTHLAHPVRHFFLHFTVHGISAATEQAIFTAPIRLPRDPAMQDLVARCIRNTTAGPGDDLPVATDAQALAYLAMSHAFGSLSSAQREECCRQFSADHPLRPAVEYIRTHLAEPLANAALAHRCGLGTHHFIRRFRDWTGQTPGQYILSERLKRAAHLLTASTLPIEQIAQQTGFSDRFHLSRQFARKFNRAPAAYRRAGRSTSPGSALTN